MLVYTQTERFPSFANSPFEADFDIALGEVQSWKILSLMSEQR